MTPEFSSLVDPIMQSVLSLIHRVEQGERPDIQTERGRIRSEFEDAERRAAGTGSKVSLDDFNLAKEALVYWADEVLTDAMPEWQDVLLEVEYYGPPRKRAWKFYEVGELRGRHTSADVAEVWYLSLVLGFLGDIRDAFRNRLNREMPGNIEDPDQARTYWARQFEHRIRDASPADRTAEPIAGHVNPLQGKRLLTAASIVTGVMFLITLGIVLSKLLGQAE